LFTARQQNGNKMQLTFYYSLLDFNFPFASSE